MSNDRVLIVALLTLMLFIAAVVARDSMIRRAPMLAVAFEHLDHTEIECVYCHHNYEDDTGFDSCYSCHKTDQTVALQMEDMFHDLCRDCHIERAGDGLASGPFRQCDSCHNDSGRMSQNLSLRPN